MRKCVILCCMFLGAGALREDQSKGNPPLRLIRTIPLPGVSGRIDHMALDIPHQRLYVAALGNNTLEVLDLREAKVVQTVAGLKEPQGLVFLADLGRLFVTAGGDGKCHVYSGDPLRLVASLDVGEDADNIRYDPAGRRLYVGYGSGALAAIDPLTLRRLGAVKLAGHPESFQLDAADSRIYVNVPEARHVAVADRVRLSVLATWPLEDLRANFPMALNEASHQVLIATRQPSKLVVLDAATGKRIQELVCAGDADDLFYDSAGKLVYVSCGEGLIDVFAEHTPGSYREAARIPTAAGARTSLWVPELNQLILAAPRRGEQQAAVLIFQRE